MIDDLKPYPAYKDSGVPWLGEVPEHWSVKRLKSTVRNVIEQSAEWRSGELYLALENVESWTGRLRPTDSDIAFDSQVKRFRAGDVLFGKLRPYLAKVTRPATAGVCVGEFLVLRPDGADGSAPYLEQLLRSKPVIDAVNSSTFGAKMPRADWQFVGCMPITLPPLAEQSAIVRFLDHADRRIRRYIRANQKLLKLLEEYKQALIHRAVTGQIDVRTGKPYPAYKPSGVEWLGEVPAHWEVLPLKRWIRINEEVLPESTSPGFEFSYLDIGTVGTGTLTAKPQHLRFGTAPTRARRIVRHGDTIVSTVRTYLKAVYFVERAPDALICSTGFAVLTPQAGTEPKFVSYLCQSAAFTDQVTADSVGIVYPAITETKLGAIHVAVPPFPEQSAIVRFLDGHTTDIDRLTSNARREIELLREYRTRLIADVVTGKLDVREAAARLPEEADEPEPLDETEVEQETEAAVNGEAADTAEEAKA
ncbi:MAG: restriction endonuclease subunit S [Bryobacterales bacterium]|nr:restriction endonuclease subunit S [Bryobacterales bacterium]